MAEANSETCEFCEQGTARLSEMAYEFPYGLGANEVVLTAVVPVWRCEDCGEVYLAEGAERRQNAAISKYLGRMNPTEIVLLRERAKLTQIEFAEHLGIGSATLKRWENGSHVPSRSLNRLLVSYARELERKLVGPLPSADRKWRTERPLRRYDAAAAFEFSLAA